MKRGMKPRHPGIIFKKMVIDALPRMTVSLAAKSMGVSRQHLNKLVKGEAAITAEMAFRIGLTTDTNASMWLGMQNKYDLWMIENSEISSQVQKRELAAA